MISSPIQSTQKLNTKTLLSHNFPILLPKFWEMCFNALVIIINSTKWNEYHDEIANYTVSSQWKKTNIEPIGVTDVFMNSVRNDAKQISNDSRTL